MRMAHLVRVARIAARPDKHDNEPTVEEDAGALLDAEAFDDLHWLRKAYEQVHRDPKK